MNQNRGFQFIKLVPGLSCHNRERPDLPTHFVDEDFFLEEILRSGRYRSRS
jgi:hypothetical protein